MNATEQKNHRTAIKELESDVSTLIEALSKTIEEGLRESYTRFETFGQSLATEAHIRSEIDTVHMGYLSRLEDKIDRLGEDVTRVGDRFTDFHQHLTFWRRLRWLLVGR